MAKLWGDWVLGFNELLLCDGHGNSTYCVDLRRIHDAAGMLDAIFAFQGTALATSEAQFNLLRALDEIHGTLCRGQPLPDGWVEATITRLQRENPQHYKYRSRYFKQRTANKKPQPAKVQ